MTPTMQEMLEALKNPPQQCANIDTGEMADAFRVVFTAAQLDWLRALLSRAGEGEEGTDADLTDQLRRGEQAEKQVVALLAQERSLLLEIANLRALSAPPSPALEAEPVAWMFRRRWGFGVQIPKPSNCYDEDDNSCEPTPLYAHPPASQPAPAVDREAVERAVCEGLGYEPPERWLPASRPRLTKTADAILSLLGGQQ